MHELDVYRAELQMQNEELRVARTVTEVALIRYTALFDFAPLGYVVLAPDESIREVNHVAARLVGCDRSGLVGESLDGFVAASARRTFRMLLRRAWATGAVHSAEVELLRADGNRAQVALSAVALVGGGDPSTLIALEDIGERKAREDQLRQTQLALRDADRRKDEFLAALSHELRNPLGPIRTSLFVLTEVISGDERVRRAQATIERQVAHLTRLVNDLLDVTRVTRGKVQLRNERLDLASLVRSTLEDHRALFDAARIHLESDLETGPLWMDGDADRLLQSLSNVLGNAHKYTPANGRVSVSLQRASSVARLRVCDTGAGIDPETLKHVFEPFAQGPQGIDRQRGGLGLGLAVVKGFVELHGGCVNVASGGPGLGTEVAIVLPLAAPMEARASTSRAGFASTSPR